MGQAKWSLRVSLYEIAQGCGESSHVSVPIYLPTYKRRVKLSSSALNFHVHYFSTNSICKWFLRTNRCIMWNHANLCILHDAINNHKFMIASFRSHLSLRRLFDDSALISSKFRAVYQVYLKNNSLACIIYVCWSLFFFILRSNENGAIIFKSDCFMH